MTVGNKVHLPVRVVPMLKRELTRLAKKHGKKPSEYIRAILEAHVQGMAFCKLDAMTHPITHNEEE